MRLPTENPRFVNAFWSRVQRGAESECWPYVGSRGAKGYGVVHLNKRQSMGAHRVAWSLANEREIPDGLVVRHACDNPPCCNPAHLSIGTAADNERDKTLRERRRDNQGERNGQARLTAEQVVAIRASNERNRVIAARFGIAQSTVSNIRARRCWVHVPEAT